MTYIRCPRSFLAARTAIAHAEVPPALAERSAHWNGVRGWNLAGGRKAVLGRRSAGSALLLACLLSVTLARPAFAQPGELDTGFGGDGKVITSFARRASVATAVAIQADGKIVASGESGGADSRFALARYNPDGSLDGTFGGDGRVRTHLTRLRDAVNAVAIQSDGRIVAAGQSGGVDATFVLVRYNADGTLDSTFGGDGSVTTDFTDGVDAANAVAIQADGKIVAAGQSGGGEFAMARYNMDGTPDTALAGDGTVTTDFSERFDAASAVAIQPDGKIVAVGGGLARYNTDGSLDPTFGGDGKVTLDVACCASVSVYDAALQPDGQIVTAGERFECFGGGGFSCESSFMLVRYNTDGTLDTTFGSNGVTFGVFGWARAVALQGDAKIVAVGSAGGGNKFAIARYDTDGTLDRSFDGDGRAYVNFTRNADHGFGVAIQTDGNIVAAGGAAVFGPHPKFALARFIST